MRSNNSTNIENVVVILNSPDDRTLRNSIQELNQFRYYIINRHLLSVPCVVGIKLVLNFTIAEYCVLEEFQ